MTRADGLSVDGEPREEAPHVLFHGVILLVRPPSEESSCYFVKGGWRVRGLVVHGLRILRSSDIAEQLVALEGCPCILASSAHPVSFALTAHRPRRVSYFPRGLHPYIPLPRILITSLTVASSSSPPSPPSSS
eukprot:6804077-Pyramimonas_sp.AAC.1